MKVKDMFHSNVQFKSDEVDQLGLHPTDPDFKRFFDEQIFGRNSNKLVLPRFVNNPILLERNREKLNKVTNNSNIINSTIHRNMMEKMVFNQMREISSMKPRLFEKLQVVQEEEPIVAKPSAKMQSSSMGYQL